MLTIKTDSKCTIEIIDLSGKILFSTVTEDQITINVSQFSKGLYFVRAYSERGNEVIKLIVE